MTLLMEIEPILRQHQIAPSRFGRDAVGDPRLIFDLKRGRVPGTRLITLVRAHLDQLRVQSVDIHEYTT
jgi:hypothetical protein